MSNNSYLEYLQAELSRVSNFFLDLRYGGHFGGKIKTRFAHLGARDYRGSNYSVLSSIFKKYKIKDSDVLVDVGCGKGRVINWWLKKGCKNKIVGLELDEEIADKAKKKFEKYDNVEIICGNALENIPKDGTIFYYYNSFDLALTKKFKNRMKEIFNRTGVLILYANCEHLEAFRDDPEWKVYTNSIYHKRGPQWKELDIEMSYPVAVMALNRLES